TGRALINVFEGELTLRVGKEAITFNLDQTSRYSTNYNDMTAKRIDVIDMACEEYFQEVLGFSDVTASGSPTPSDDPIISTTSPMLTPCGDSDFLLFEEANAFLGLEDDPDSPELDPSYYDPEGDIQMLKAILNSDPTPSLPNHKQFVPSFTNELKACEAKTIKSSVDEPPAVELKDLPPHLEYAFIEGDNKLPVIIAKELGEEEKVALIKVLKSHKRAIAWKLSDIQGINPEFCTHKILMEECKIHEKYRSLPRIKSKASRILKDGVTRLKKYSELSSAEATQADCDVKATNIILHALPLEIYALVSTHKVAKDLWERIQMLMQGTSLTKQERECKLYDAFDKFAYQKGKTLRDFHLIFSLLLNEMNMYNMKLEQFQVNTKFLNTLPPKWSKFVTDVKLVRDLHTTNIDQLHAYLGQHEYHANEVRLMRERHFDRLALISQHRLNRPTYQHHQQSYHQPQFQQQASPYQTMATMIEQQVALDEALVPNAQRAFLVTADVPEIYMQEFWATATVHQHSIRFKMDTRKHIVDLEAFREMLHISPRVSGQSFTELPFKEEILEFLSLGDHSLLLLTSA
nr:reverse transcriptase domain-containing protein [Tanacetum cinerariifolium]